MSFYSGWTCPMHPNNITCSNCRKCVCGDCGGDTRDPEREKCRKSHYWEWMCRKCSTKRPLSGALGLEIPNSKPLEDSIEESIKDISEKWNLMYTGIQRLRDLVKLARETK